VSQRVAAPGAKRLPYEQIGLAPPAASIPLSSQSDDLANL
jgi:hypothetical protein